MEVIASSLIDHTYINMSKVRTIQLYKRSDSVKLWVKDVDYMAML